MILFTLRNLDSGGGYTDVFKTDKQVNYHITNIDTHLPSPGCKRPLEDGTCGCRIVMTVADVDNNYQIPYSGPVGGSDAA